MKISEYGQNFVSSAYNQISNPRWQTVAKWAAGISLVALGTGLAIYAGRNDWFSSDLPKNDPEDTISEGSTQDQSSRFDSFYHQKMPFNQYRARDFKPSLSSIPNFSQNATPIALLQQNLIQKMLNDHRQLELPSINDTLSCVEIEQVQIPCIEMPFINGTLPCVEDEPDQEWIVCEEAPVLNGSQECEVPKNVCISGAEKPGSLFASAGSVALKCAAQAGSKICSTTINAGEAALRIVTSATYRTGRMCVKGLLAAKVSHHTLGTADPNPYLIKLLSGTRFKCLAHDIAPLLRRHGVPLR